jgi:hypothetical protein
MQLVREIPEELKTVGEAVKARVRQSAAVWRSTGGQTSLARHRCGGAPHSLQGFLRCSLPPL